MYHDCIMTLPTFKKKGNCRVVIHFRAEMVKWHETKERNESVKPRRANTNARKEKKLKNTYDIREGPRKEERKERACEACNAEKVTLEVTRSSCMKRGQQISKH